MVGLTLVRMDVLQRIERWLEDTSKILDISGLDLKEWPEILKGKEHLIVKLDCAINQLTSIPILLNCVWLDCSENQLTSLPELFNCVKLYCCNNKLAVLPVLKNCKELDCSYNHLTSLSEMTNCVALWCSNNKLTSLLVLPNCETLSCSGNQLTSLPALPKCFMLFCSDNQFSLIKLSDWKKIWKLKSSIYRTRGIFKFLRILKLRLYLPRLDHLHEELLKSPNHPGKFYQIPLLKAWNKYKSRN